MLRPSDLINQKLKRLEQYFKSLSFLISIFISKEEELILNRMCSKIEFYRTIYGNVIVFRNIQLENGYNKKITDIAIKVPYGYYGEARFDMFWIKDNLCFSNGRKLTDKFNRVRQCDLILDQKTWYRWSRHYTDRNYMCSVLQHIDFSLKQVGNEVSKNV